MNRHFPLFQLLLLLFFIVLSTNAVFACRNPVWLFNTGEWAGIIAFFVFLIGASADSHLAIRDMIISLIFVIISVVLVVPYLHYYLLSPTGVSAILFAFTALFTIRVITQASEKPGYYTLLIFVPLLAYLIFNAPPLRVMIGHGVCSSRISYIGSGLEMYAEKHGGRFPEKLQELIPEYVDEIPVCKVQGDFDENNPRYRLYVTRHNMKNTPYRYELNDDRTRFTLYCVSNNHIPYGQRAPYSAGKGVKKKRDEW